MLRTCLVVLVCCGTLSASAELWAADERWEAAEKKVDQLLQQVRQWQQQLRRPGETERRGSPTGRTPTSEPAARPRQANGPRRAVPPAEPRQRRVIRLRNAPATDTARLIVDLLEQERPEQPSETVILPDALNNALLVSAPPAAFAPLLQLVEMLDQPPAAVRVQLRLVRAARFDTGQQPAAAAKLPELRRQASSGPEQDGPPQVTLSAPAAEQFLGQLVGSQGWQVLADAQLVALNNQAAQLKLSHKPTGSPPTHPPGGAESGQLPAELMLAVTPRVGPDGRVTMEIDMEHTTAAPRQGSASRVASAMIQSTVTIADGQTLVLSGLNVRDGNLQSQLLVLVTAKLVRP